MNEINQAPNLLSVMQTKVTQQLTVALSSSCNYGTVVRVELAREEKFFINHGLPSNLAVSPSQPRYAFYRFKDNDSDTATIEVESSDDNCLIVSIQDSQCPVFDLNKDVRFKGKFQTVSKKGGLTIKRRDFHEGFFIVFVAQPDNSDCSEDLTLDPGVDYYYERNSDETTNVTFVVQRSLDRNQYINSMMITLAAIFIFYVIAIALIVIFRKYGSIKDLTASSLQISLRDDEVDDAYPRSVQDIIYVLEKNNLDVKTLTKYPLKDKKRSFNYLWHIMSIAIFYSIPVIQLVITYQRIVNVSGNEDLCYYNFLCAHPTMTFSDFNHIYSNIGYLFMGILFLIATAHRQSIIPFRFEIGIPVHYGIYYSMGVALIIEGLLSACYHICPSQSNYQFDTSFMYVMAVLCMIKLYQNRHPDLNATAYSTFSVLGAGIMMATLGIMNGTLTVWLIFIFGYSLMCLYISFKIYYLSYILKGFNKLRQDISKLGFASEVFIPVKKARFIILVLVNLLNTTLLLAGMSLYFKGGTDFGTFLLGLLMANAILYILFYLVMKIYNNEKLCTEAIVYFILAIVTWTAATIFFLDAATLWTVTPAESRQWNQECILLGYYDKHDVWHLLSAPALYFTFMFLMCLDDDIIDKKQDEIPVF
ncbi:hypothetical protein WA026_017331 [Henosepilachna vigintioctopunctata]